MMRGRNRYPHLLVAEGGADNRQVAGTSKAAPMPCTARARISESTVGERPPQMEARVKTAMPMA